MSILALEDLLAIRIVQLVCVYRFFQVTCCETWTSRRSFRIAE